MEAIELLRAIQLRAMEYRSRFPTDTAIVSILKQLEYLIELCEGTRCDCERLNDIIIGVLTVREIEPVDEAFAEELYEAVEVVEELKRAKIADIS